MDSHVDESRLFIPALPTASPKMLFQQGRSHEFPPFSESSARHFYFARNAVWLVTRFLGLAGKEVLVPAYHHGVEIEALVDAGAKVKFYRVGSHWDVDLADVEQEIGPNTKALYLIHYAGFPGPARQMSQLARRHGLFLIEDCALSLLSSDGNRPLGTTGDVGIFCVYKTLPVPNGGALILNGVRSYAIPEPPPPPIHLTLRHLASSLLRNLEMRGGTVGRWFRRKLRQMGQAAAQMAKVELVATGTQHFNRDHVNLGMSAITRRIVQACDFQSIVELRRRNYFSLLGQLRDISPPLFHELPPGACPLFYPLVVSDKTEVMGRLALRGIETVDFWRHFHPACDPSEFPEVAQLRNSILEIPCHQDLGAEQMAYLARGVREALTEDAPADVSKKSG